MMNTAGQKFLEAFRCALLSEQTDWDEMAGQDWMDLFRLAEQHHVLPMIYESVFRCPAIAAADPGMMMFYRQRMMQMVAVQAMQTGEFLQLYRRLREKDLEPLIVKGIVCRNLYPNPDARMSGDEDMLIRPEQFKTYQEILAAYGMIQADPSADAERDYEVAYGKPGSRIYIEVHKSLFPPESDAYGDFNEMFEQVRERAMDIEIDGGKIRTMCHTDHLLYLICHAFKHFLHSGFGLRQCADIVLYGNAYGQEIDWAYILEKCQSVHAEYFAAALFKIGEKYLTFDKEKACYPQSWQALQVDEEALLEDLLVAGVYGDASMSRKHSSTITLDAVASEKQGRKQGGVLKSAFPSAKSLESRYSYLKKYPWLLPVAWVSRLVKYYQETKNMEENDAVGAIEIGSQRVALLKQYKVIK